MHQHLKVAPSLPLDVRCHMKWQRLFSVIVSLLISPTSGLFCLFPISRRRKCFSFVVRSQIFRLSRKPWNAALNYGRCLHYGPITNKSWVSWAGPGKSLSSSRSQEGDRNGGTSREDGGKVLQYEIQWTTLVCLCKLHTHAHTRFHYSSIDVWNCHTVLTFGAFVITYASDSDASILTWLANVTCVMRSPLPLIHSASPVGRSQDLMKHFNHSVFILANGVKGRRCEFN